MRDELKDIKYFNEFIDEDVARIEKFTDKLKSGEVKPERIVPVKSKIHDLQLGVLIAKYSKGDELSLLEKGYVDLIKNWEEVWEPDYYSKNLKMISLGVLFEVDKAYAEQIQQMLKKSNINDWLLSFLLDSWNEKRTDGQKQLLFPDKFSMLQKAVYEENKTAFLKKYLLEEWYTEDCGCYEAHKSKQNIYYGYWSFEAGAVAKILDIDDSGLKGVLYYPYDLVHYRK